MPKTTSKSFKKKKYNARFPPARIKKIMQTDEEVGKVAAAVPVIISRALEMFIESLITDAAKLTVSKNAKTLSTSHIKQAITATNQYDFLRDLVKHVPDHQTEDSNGEASINGESSTSIKKGKGRPRKIDPGSHQKRKRRSGNKSSSDEEDDDDYDDESEETETDEELMNATAPSQSSLSDNRMSHNNNVLPPPPPPAGPASHVPGGPLLSDTNQPQVLPPLGHYVSGDPQSAPHQQIQQPWYPMSSSISSMPSSLLPPHLSANSAFYNGNPLVHPVLVSHPLVTPQIQQHPVDLTNSLPHTKQAAEDNDYDT